MSLRAWAELLRVSALFTVPGDALAGAASAGVRPNRGTALAVGASLCLYEAGMALNDWADRDEDAVERPHRPIPSGRITPNAALTAAGALTATGLLLASRAGRPTLALSTALAATVWAYDLRLKHTSAGPLAMGAARTLDVLMGATATSSATARTPRPTIRSLMPPTRRGVLDRLSAWAGRPARRGRATTPVETLANKLARSTGDRGRTASSFVAPLDALVAKATGSVAGSASPAAPGAGARLSAWAAGPAVPRGAGAGPVRTPVEALASKFAGSAGPRPATLPWHGGTGTESVPRGALLPAGLLGAHTLAVTTVSRREVYGGSVGAPAAALVATGVLAAVVGRPRTDSGPPGLVAPVLAAVFAGTAGRAFLHAALNPSPQLTQRAVGGGIRAMIPFQAALAARGGAPGVGLAVMGLVPLARKLAKKVSVT
ncbi:UbiA family prenyltransferase [Streptomyces sp. NPDC006645]|uniref:UbiA family prenyltransferase n=1 Tax=Streptomyces sp. NPDC006645 TaxID=3157184 RepID=UPI0033A004DE